MPKKGQLSSIASPRSKYQRKFNSTPIQKKRRAERNASRNKLKKAGVNLKNLDVDHANHRTGDKSRKNLRVRSIKANRSDNAHKGKKK